MVNFSLRFSIPSSSIEIGSILFVVSFLFFFFFQQRKFFLIQRKSVGGLLREKHTIDITFSAPASMVGLSIPVGIPIHHFPLHPPFRHCKIGRASCRERVCQ